jgi:peroxiredoxin
VKVLSLFLILTLFVACGSTEVVRTTDKCSMKKHTQDDIYQVRINDKPVNDRWFLKEDAQEMIIILGVMNKCMRK